MTEHFVYGERNAALTEEAKHFTLAPSSSRMRGSIALAGMRLAGTTVILAHAGIQLLDLSH